MENIALTESTYYILLSLYHPQHGYGIMQQTEHLSGGRVRLAKKDGFDSCRWRAGAVKKNIS